MIPVDIVRPVPVQALLRAGALTAGLAFCSCLVGCSAPEAPVETGTGPREAEVESAADRARRLSRELVIVDTHIDLPYRLHDEWYDVSGESDQGDFDYARARAGGLDVAFLSIYVPADRQETGTARELGDELIDSVERLAADHPEQFTVIHSIEEIAPAREAGRIAFALGMENGAPIEGDLDNLRHFYDRGIRYITLTHSKNNHICDSSYEKPDERRWNGLSPFGREVVAEMNRLGVMIDVSHVSDATFDQVMELSLAPVIASHSSARRFVPDFERNLDDARIEALAANGGVLQINFGSGFLTAEARAWGETARSHIVAWAEDQGVDPRGDEAKAYLDQYRSENPYPYANVADVVAHIDHVVDLVGIDHVGLGSDFDGVGDSLPRGLEDVSQYPNLIAALADRGYSDAEIEKIVSGNLLRVWREVEATADRLRSS